MRPTREDFRTQCHERSNEIKSKKYKNIETSMLLVARIYEKYLSDPNSVESPETKSE